MQRFAAEKAKRSRAIKKVEKQEKEIEKKQMHEYKQYLMQRKLIEEQKEKEALLLTKLKLKEINEQMRTDQEHVQMQGQLLKSEHETLQRQLQQITERLMVKNEKQAQSLESIKKSRNSYFQKVMRVHTEFKQRSTL